MTKENKTIYWNYILDSQTACPINSVIYIFLSPNLEHDVDPHVNVTHSQSKVCKNESL